MIRLAAVSGCAPARRLALGLALVAWAGLGSACGAGGPDRPADDSSWVDLSAVHEPGFGELRLVAADGNRLVARTYRARDFDRRSGPIWYVMHGASRDVERYIREAAPVAERYGALAVAVHFPKRLYPRSDDYTLGVGDPWQVGRRTWSNLEWRDPDTYLYATLETLFDGIVAELEGNQRGYYVFGHSAGAQFTHRLITFLPEQRVLRAVAANAGWYTLPAADDPRTQTVPYGLVRSPVAPSGLGECFATPLVVMLGAADTMTAADDDLVRETREAQAQGRNRLERGRFYFATAQAEARRQGLEFDWRLAVVPGAGHDAGQMIDSAGYFLFAADPRECTPSTASAAAGLVFTEILADPPDGPAGDVNGDGHRDPQEDEFVELYNPGPDPLCLDGWTLGDAQRPDRHLFPLGSTLQPGEFLVVFGGGVPTGEFGGARLQWANRGLSLSNAGDVVILRDATGAVVRAVSWGDADGAAPAESHFDGGLGLAASIVQAPGSGTWTVHAPSSGRRFSPGELDPRPDGGSR